MRAPATGYLDGPLKMNNKRSSVDTSHLDRLRGTPDKRPDPSIPASLFAEEAGDTFDWREPAEIAADAQAAEKRSINDFASDVSKHMERLRQNGTTPAATPREKRAEPRIAPTLVPPPPPRAREYLAVEIPADIGRVDAVEIKSWDDVDPPRRKPYLAFAIVAAIGVLVPGAWNAVSRYQETDAPQAIASKAAPTPPTPEQLPPATTVPSMSAEVPDMVPLQKAIATAITVSAREPQSPPSPPLPEVTAIVPTDAPEEVLVTGAGSADPTPPVPAEKIAAPTKASVTPSAPTQSAMIAKPFEPTATSGDTASRGTTSRALPSITPPSSGPFGALPKSTPTTGNAWLKPQPFQP